MIAAREPRRPAALRLLSAPNQGLLNAFGVGHERIARRYPFQKSEKRRRARGQTPKVAGLARETRSKPV